MKYCTHCKVNVNHQHSNCPLCGSYLNEKFNNDNCTTYLPFDNCVTRPIIAVDTTTSFLKTKFYKLMIAVCLISFLLNLLFAKDTPWSAYVVIGVIMLLYAVIFPIVEKTKLQKQIRHNLFLFTIVAVCLELTVTRLQFGWVSVFDVLPWIYLGIIAVIDFLIIFRRYKEYGLFSTLILATIFAIVPSFIYLFIGNGETDVGLSIVFFCALLNCAVVFIVCTRSAKEELQRKLNA